MVIRQGKEYLRQNSYILLYVALAVILLPLYRFQLNPDAVSYIGIAKKYSNGLLFDAFNGTWGPLISWSLAPLLSMGIEPLVAAKIVTLSYGLAALVALRKLSDLFPINTRVRGYLVFSFVPIILSFTLTLITPDIFVVAFVALFLSQLASPKYFDGVKHGLASGIWGAMIYFSKGFGFPYFIATFSAVNIYYFFSMRTFRKRIVINFLAGFVTFLLLAAPWICTLSYKYGKFLISSAGQYNIQLVAPGKEFIHPTEELGFVEPPNATAISAGEDSEPLTVKRWNPIGSWKELKHFLRLLIHNVLEAFEQQQIFSFFSILIIIFWLHRSFKVLKLKGKSEPFVPTLISYLIYTAGYVLIFVERRYLWIHCFLLMIVGISQIELWKTRLSYSSKARNIFLGVFLFSFLFNPVSHLWEKAFFHSATYQLGVRLKNEKIQGRFASNKNFQKSLYLALITGSQYLGSPPLEASPDFNLAAELNEHHVDYYFVWGHDKWEFKGEEPLLALSEEDLRIYKVSGRD